jgi:hypothetical protein
VRCEDFGESDFIIIAVRGDDDIGKRPYLPRHLFQIQQHLIGMSHG